MKRIVTVPGKIILSGEYAVVFGEPGIAIPSPTGMTVTWERGGTLSIHDANGDASMRCRAYLRRIIAECERMSGKACTGPLTIESRIPLGRGMGSSTALVIGVCRALLGNDCEDQAKEINDIVDPGNSGLDFAVIWRNSPVLFCRGEPVQPIELDVGFLEQALLIDTGQPNETTPELVEWMEGRIASGGEEERSLREAFAIIGQCTRSLLEGEHPMTVFPAHYRAQLTLGIVPDHVHQLVLAIEKAGGVAKVLGAGGRTGGGGVVLALHSNPNELLAIAEKHRMLSPIILNS